MKVRRTKTDSGVFHWTATGTLKNLSAEPVDASVDLTIKWPGPYSIDDWESVSVELPANGSATFEHRDYGFDSKLPKVKAEVDDVLRKGSFSICR